ncbi:MAG: AAA family ATPase [Thermoguttaceae bacterium]
MSPLIEGVRVRNYRVLKDVTLGRVTTPAAEPLTPLTVVIGKNGFGKSTLFDAFGFLADTLESGVEVACGHRGGFSQIVSQGTDKKLEFQIRYGDLIYTVVIAADNYGSPSVFAETLSRGEDFFLNELREGSDERLTFFFREGHGQVIRADGAKVGTTVGSGGDEFHLADNRRLALATLGNLTQYPDLVAFKRFLDGWYLSHFSARAAHSLPQTGPQRRLTTRGDNLANVVQYMEREHPERLKNIVRRLGERIHGLGTISTKETEDRRLLLCFHNRGFDTPFYASQMSDGTLKLFAVILLLGDPDPPPFVCFEEPENGLYHNLLAAFVGEIRDHVEQRCGSQFFITTHQPYLVDALSPEEVWILDKGEDGFARVRRASEMLDVKEMVREGTPLGALWCSEYLEDDGCDTRYG